MKNPTSNGSTLLPSLATHTQWEFSGWAGSLQLTPSRAFASSAFAAWMTCMRFASGSRGVARVPNGGVVSHWSQFAVVEEGALVHNRFEHALLPVKEIQLF